jgi:hypothetical protein
MKRGPYQDRLTGISAVVGEAGNVECSRHDRRIEDLVLGLKAAKVADGFPIQILTQAGFASQAVLQLFLRHGTSPVSPGDILLCQLSLYR